MELLMKVSPGLFIYSSVIALSVFVLAGAWEEKIDIVHGEKGESLFLVEASDSRTVRGGDSVSTHDSLFTARWQAFWAVVRGDKNVSIRGTRFIEMPTCL